MNWEEIKFLHGDTYPDIGFWNWLEAQYPDGFPEGTLTTIKGKLGIDYINNALNGWWKQYQGLNDEQKDYLRSTSVDEIKAYMAGEEPEKPAEEVAPEEPSLRLPTGLQTPDGIVPILWAETEEGLDVPIIPPEYLTRQNLQDVVSSILGDRWKNWEELGYSFADFLGTVAYSSVAHYAPIQFGFPQGEISPVMDTIIRDFARRFAEKPEPYYMAGPEEAPDFTRLGEELLRFWESTYGTQYTAEEKVVIRRTVLPQGKWGRAGVTPPGPVKYPGELIPGHGATVIATSPEEARALGQQRYVPADIFTTYQGAYEEARQKSIENWARRSNAEWAVRSGLATTPEEYAQKLYGANIEQEARKAVIEAAGLSPYGIRAGYRRPGGEVVEEKPRVPERFGPEEREFFKQLNLAISSDPQKRATANIGYVIERATINPYLKERAGERWRTFDKLHYQPIMGAPVLGNWKQLVNKARRVTTI